MNPGDKVLWNSKTGWTVAEYRGKTLGLDGWEATIICRPAGECPYQITVPMSQIVSDFSLLSRDQIKAIDARNVQDVFELLRAGRE